MPASPHPLSRRGLALTVGVLALAVLGIPPAVALRTAWWGESRHVTGAAAVWKDGVPYVTVSGSAEHLSRAPVSEGAGTRSQTFPRVITYRATDGERVAVRHYAPVVWRGSAVDTVVQVLTAADERVWVVSSDPDTALHAVEPVGLADVVDQAALAARVPALASGLHRDGDDGPVLVDGSRLVLRVNAGPWLALDPATLMAHGLGPEPAVVDALARAGSPRGLPAVEAAVRARPDRLEPVVLPTTDIDGRPDPAVAYVVSQSTLDRSAAVVRVSRWDVEGPDAVERWTTTLDGVPPTCCQRHAWRAGELTLVWWETWLVALDDTTGAVRWTRRL